MDAVSAAQQALAQAQLALSLIATPSTTTTQPQSISANTNVSVNGDEEECAGCSKLEDQLAMERGRARERERRLLKEVKGLRDELSALGWTGSVPVALMDDYEEGKEPAQRRSLRHDMAPPAAKRLRIDVPQDPAPFIRASTIRATAASSSSVTSKSKSKSKAKAKPPPAASILSLNPSTSASASGSARPRLPPTPKPGSLRLAAHDLRVPPDPNVVASAAAAMSLRLRGGLGRLQMAWGEKLPSFLWDAGMHEYELPWWVMGDEGVDYEEEEEEDQQESDEAEDEDEPEMSAEEREKAKKREAKNAAERIRRAAQRERLAAERKELEGARVVESHEDEQEGRAVELEGGDTSTSTDTKTSCSHCHVTTTPLWRRDPSTQRPLCNACGLYLQQHKALRPQALIDDGAREDAKEEEGPSPQPQCSHCLTHQTSMWRKSKTGQQVCNACGIYERAKGEMRPLSLRGNEFSRGRR